MKNKRNRKKIFAACVIFVFICSTVCFTAYSEAVTLPGAGIDEGSFGRMCVGQIMPGAADPEKSEDKSRDRNDDDGEVIAEKGENIAKKTEEKKKKKDKDEKKEESMKLSKKPLVIIYHTHSSESYMPYKASNYHREKEKGTVRDVGSVVKKTLEKKGIRVIHDKTLHDRPSYNESYNRSLETITALRKKYPSADYIIDLHRDAAPSSVSEGKYTVIDGKRVAKFSLVVGQQNENYVELYDYAKKVSEKAEGMYSGFGSSIIERNYRYNEYISNRSLLLEIGNNRNTIEEARLCGRYFAEVLASIIAAEQ